MGSIQKLNVIPLLTQTPAARSSRGSRTIMNPSFYFFTHMGDLVLKLQYLQGKLKLLPHKAGSYIKPFFRYS